MAKNLYSYQELWQKSLLDLTNLNFLDYGYLKEIADVVSIDFNLTHHIARKTFASTVLLYNDVPMEIVSKLLGHSSMKITQDSYGRKWWRRRLVWRWRG